MGVYNYDHGRRVGPTEALNEVIAKIDAQIADTEQISQGRFPADGPRLNPREQLDKNLLEEQRRTLKGLVRQVIAMKRAP